MTTKFCEKKLCSHDAVAESSKKCVGSHDLNMGMAFIALKKRKGYSTRGDSKEWKCCRVRRCCVKNGGLKDLLNTRHVTERIRGA